MAGNPKRRARRAAEANADTGTALPLASAPAPAHHARAPAPTRARPNALPPVRGLKPGPGVARVADAHAVDQVQQFADALRPGAVVRIERLRPTWCAGWVDEVDLDAAGYRELMRYIHDQWGGQHYKLSIMGTNEAVLMETRQPIAGPPRVNGQQIDRRAWDRAMNGDSGPEAPAAAAAPAAQDPVAMATALIQAVSSMGDNRENKIIDAVKEITNVSAQNTAALLQRIDAERSAEKQTGTLGHQLSQLSEGMDAIESIKGKIADTLPEPADGGIESSPLGALASRIFADKVAGSLGGDNVPTPQNSQGTFDPSPNAAPTGVPVGIPDAKG